MKKKVFWLTVALILLADLGISANYFINNIQIVGYACCCGTQDVFDPDPYECEGNGDCLYGPWPEWGEIPCGGIYCDEIPGANYVWSQIGYCEDVYWKEALCVYWQADKGLFVGNSIYCEYPYPPRK